MTTSSCDENVNAQILRWKAGKRRACLVCGRLALFYHYYGEMCCEACKKFFRRMVLQADVPACLNNDSKCDVTKAKCRHCRYQKCLLMRVDRKFLKVKSPENIDRLIDGLKQMEQPFKRLWDLCVPLPEAYTNRHQTLAALLQDSDNLLMTYAANGKFLEKSTVDDGGWDKAQFIAEVDTNGLFSKHAVNIHAVNDWFIGVELAKAFPFFRELCLQDQICQLRHIGVPLRCLINSFYSHAIKAQCITRKNGLEQTALLEAKQIRENQIIRTIFIQSSCHLVVEMSKQGLLYEEFLLLMAILLSNSNADGLSPSGRQQLYKESCRYSKALQQLCQHEFGPNGGAQKFASLLELLGYAIGHKYKFLSMFAYIEVFYTKFAITATWPQIMQSKDAHPS